MYMYCLGYSVFFGFMLCFYVFSMCEAQDQNTSLLLHYCGPYLVQPNLSQLFYWHLAPVVQTLDRAIHRINH